MYAEPVLLVTPVLPLVDMTSAPSMKRRAPSSDTIDNAYVPGVTTVSLPCETTPGSEISDRDERVLNSCVNSKVSSFTQELK